MLIRIKYFLELNTLVYYILLFGFSAQALIVLGLILLVLLVKEMSSRKLVLGCFRDGNTITTGLRGRGKDLLFDTNMETKEYSYFGDEKTARIARRMWYIYKIDERRVKGNG